MPLTSLLNLVGGLGMTMGPGIMSAAHNSREAAKNRKFQAEQAQLQRDWLTEMSNTAHQREVDDLYAAGLNPILSSTGGSGASTPSAGLPSGSQAAPADFASSASAVLTAVSRAFKEQSLLDAEIDKTAAEASFIKQQESASASSVVRESTRLLNDIHRTTAEIDRWKNMTDVERRRLSLSTSEVNAKIKELEIRREMDRKMFNLNRSRDFEKFNVSEENKSRRLKYQQESESARQSERLRFESQMLDRRLDNELKREVIRGISSAVSGSSQQLVRKFLKGK